MKALGLFLAAALLTWASLIYTRLRAPRRGTLWLPVKLAAANFAIGTTLMGIAGSIIGILAASRALVTGYALLAVAAGVLVVRTWLTREVFISNFGTTVGGVK